MNQEISPQGVKFNLLEPLVLLGLRYGVSDRSSGPMNVKPYDDDPMVTKSAPANRERFLAALGWEPHQQVMLPHLQHGNEVVIVTGDNVSQRLEVDGLVTSRPIWLGATGGDCIIGFAVDAQRKVVAIFHCGWRGVARDIMASTVEAFKSLGCRPKNLVICLGPSLQPCHMVLQKREELSPFYARRYGQYIHSEPDGYHLDLPAIVRNQATAAGVPWESVEIARDCTYCLPERYHSYRRDERPQGRKPLVMLSCITWLSS